MAWFDWLGAVGVFILAFIGVGVAFVARERLEEKRQAWVREADRARNVATSKAGPASSDSEGDLDPPAELKDGNGG
jgi:hypothetical protein